MFVLPEAAPHIFLDGMIDRAVAAKLIANLRIGEVAFVGHESRLAVNLAGEDRAQRLGVDGRNVA